MRLRRGIEALLVTAGAIAATVALTYPLAFRLDRVGRVDTSDGQLSIWNVAWVARTLVTDPSHLFDANIFYPHRQTLAYSEANVGAGALAVVPYWASGGNPYLAHNVVVLVAFTLACLAMYALVRRHTGSVAASWLAGMAFAFCPFVFARTAHIQLMMTFGLPLVLLAFFSFLERQTPATVVALAAALVAQALLCGYYGVFAGLMVTLGVLFFAPTGSRWRSWPYWTGAAAAAALTCAALLPFFLPYLQIGDAAGGQFRSLDDAREYSAHWQAYLGSGSLAHRWWLPLLPQRNEVLFPGVIVTLGAFGGILAVLRRGKRGTAHTTRKGTASARQIAAFYVLVAVVAAWLSFGPDAGLFAVLYQHVPIFSFLRAPVRFGLLVTLACVALAGFGLHALFQHVRRPALAAPVVGFLLLPEVAHVPIAFRDVPPVAPAYRVLATLPRGAVAEFPFYYRPIDFHRHCRYMLNSTVHWQPLINGYSDHIPIDFRRMVDPLSGFPSREAFAILKARGARYVVLHLNYYLHRSLPNLMERLQQFREHLQPRSLEGDVWLYEIVSFPSDLPR